MGARGAHEHGGLPVALCAEAVAVGHQPLYRDAGQLLQGAKILEGIGERTESTLLEERAEGLGTLILGEQVEFIRREQMADRHGRYLRGQQADGLRAVPPRWWIRDIVLSQQLRDVQWSGGSNRRPSAFRVWQTCRLAELAPRTRLLMCAYGRGRWSTLPSPLPSISGGLPVGGMPGSAPRRYLTRLTATASAVTGADDDRSPTDGRRQEHGRCGCPRRSGRRCGRCRAGLRGNQRVTRIAACRLGED
jgi:hypothetical protein